MRNTVLIICVAAVLVGLRSVEAANVFNMPTGLTSLETVHVGNAGNAGEQSRLPLDTTYYGGAAYEYNIGKYEVTAGQYRDFLNAVDPNGANADGLYNSNMDSNSRGCQITWNAAASTYDFSGGTEGSAIGTVAEWQDRPVNYVSWHDAAMFANYLTSGNVNDGAYDTTAAGWDSSTASDYTGITSHDSAEMDTLISTYGRVYVIPTEDEWYKAAYYDSDKDPNMASDQPGYWDYPTSSNSVPSNDLTDPDDGNNATCYAGGYTIGSPYYRTEVGAHENSDSPYGTFDQGGNVWEWNETLIGSDRGLLGGTVYTSVGNLHASARFELHPTYEYYDIGFRVAQVPEPATVSLLAIGGLTLVRRRKRVESK